MTPELKSLWIAALRSGKYKQGKNFLRQRDNSFCCLGVLCDLVEPENWGNFSTHAYGFSTIAANGDNVTVAAYPSQLFLEHVGLEDRDAQTLAAMNDCGEEFRTIATWIKEKIK